MEITSSVVIIGLLQVFHHTVKACVTSLVNHNSRRRLSAFGKTETAVADTPARWTHPGLVQECFLYLFPVAVEKTRATKLPTNTATVDVVANGFCVDGLLSALVASSSVCTVVDLFGCFDGHFGQFPFCTHGLVVKGNLNWFIVTQSTFSVRN